MTTTSTIYSFTHTDKDLETYYRERSSRTLKYLSLAPQLFEAERSYLDEVTTLRRQGLLRIPGFFPRDTILEVGRRVDALVADRQALSRIRNHAAETVEDIQNGRFAYYTVEEMRDQAFSLREKVSSVGIVEPLLQLPEIAGLVFDDRLLQLATAYFATVPVMSYLKIRSTFVNDLPVVDTQFFHSDFGSYKILKAFIYLNDVTVEGGPFCYIQRSHTERFPGWDQKSRFSDDELKAIYGDDCITHCTANAGDIYLAETTGFHRGLKPIQFDRNILILTFCVHREYGFNYEPNQITRSTFERLSEMGQAAADALRVVE